MGQRLPSEVGRSSIFNAVNANNATWSFKKVVEIAGLVVVPVEVRWTEGSITLSSCMSLHWKYIKTCCISSVMGVRRASNPWPWRYQWRWTKMGTETSMWQSRKCGCMATRGAVVIDNSCVVYVTCKTNVMFFCFVNLLLTCFLCKILIMLWEKIPQGSNIAKKY